MLNHGLVAPAPPTMTGAVSLCVREWLHYNWTSRPVDAREPQSICVSIARAPTAYLLLFSPLAKTSSARNTIFGHPIGLIGGYAALVVTGAGPTRSGSRRYLLAKNPGGRSFAFSYGGRGEANSRLQFCALPVPTRLPARSARASSFFVTDLRRTDRGGPEWSTICRDASVSGPETSGGPSLHNVAAQ